VIDACKTPPRRLPIRHRSARSGAVIRVQMIRSDTRHPDRRRRHQGRASCEVAGRRFETEGPAPIYKLTTLTVAGLPQRVPSSGGLAAVCATRPSDGPEHPQERDRAPAAVIRPHTPNAA